MMGKRYSTVQLTRSEAFALQRFLNEAVKGDEQAFQRWIDVDWKAEEWSAKKPSAKAIFLKLQVMS